MKMGVVRDRAFVARQNMPCGRIERYPVQVGDASTCFFDEDRTRRWSQSFSRYCRVAGILINKSAVPCAINAYFA
jgi:hypothetical protein